MDIQKILQKRVESLVSRKFYFDLFLRHLAVYRHTRKRILDMKTLIVYYSRTGNTQTACEALQKELGCDIIEIKDLEKQGRRLGLLYRCTRLDVQHAYEDRPRASRPCVLWCRYHRLARLGGQARRGNPYLYRKATGLMEKKL